MGFGQAFSDLLDPPSLEEENNNFRNVSLKADTKRRANDVAQQW